MTRRIEYAFLFAVLALALAAFCVFSRVALADGSGNENTANESSNHQATGDQGAGDEGSGEEGSGDEAPATRALATKAKRWGFRKVRKLRSRLVLSLAVPRFETQCV